MASQINASNSGFGGIVSTGDSSGELQLQTAGTTAVTINTSQNVGIGTTSPATKLQISGTSGSLNARINAGNTGLDVTNNDATGVTDLATSPLGAGGKVMTFTTYTGSASAERMRIDSSGNVGIGTSSPAYKLDVVGSLNVTADSFYRIGAGTDRFITYRTGNSDILYSFDSGDFYRQDIANSNHSWFTGNAERMRIDSSGNVLVNTTGTWVTAKSAVVGAGTASTFAFAAFQGGGAAGAAGAFRVDGTGTDLVTWYYQGGVVGRVTTNSANTTYGTSSDYRLKEDIAPIVGALATVAALKPVTYKWKVDGSDGQGFIAHELQEIFPDAVQGEKDAVDAEGKPVYQGIDTSFLVATLTAAIQEMKAIIDAQSVTINDLKARIETLEAK